MARDSFRRFTSPLSPSTRSDVSRNQLALLWPPISLMDNTWMTSWEAGLDTEFLLS